MKNLKIFTSPDPTTSKDCIFVQAEGFEPYKVIEVELQKEAVECGMTELTKICVLNRLNDYIVMCTGFVEERDKFMKRLFES